MTTPPIGRTSATPAPLPEHERLRRAARDLEGVFVEQMFKAMRESVPEGGVVDGGTGEEMFTALLDQKLSALVPTKWDRGLAEAVYGQLRGRVGEGVDGVGSRKPEVGSGMVRPPTPDLRLPTRPSSLPPDTPILTSDKRPEQP